MRKQFATAFGLPLAFMAAAMPAYGQADNSSIRRQSGGGPDGPLQPGPGPDRPVDQLCGALDRKTGARKMDSASGSFAANNLIMLKGRCFGLKPNDAFIFGVWYDPVTNLTYRNSVADLSAQPLSWSQDSISFRPGRDLSHFYNVPAGNLLRIVVLKNSAPAHLIELTPEQVGQMRQILLRKPRRPVRPTP